MPSRPLIAVVDDDESVRESLPDLLRELGFDADAFSSAEDFLKSGSINRTDCLILDVAMPGMSGPELCSELKRCGLDIPTIFITAYSIERIRSRIGNVGPLNCLLKPFNDTALLAAIQAALKG